MPRRKIAPGKQPTGAPRSRPHNPATPSERTMEKIHNLLKAADAIQRHAEPDVAEWFQSGLNRYLAGRDSFDRALGLSSQGTGQPLARTKYSKQLRDEYLRQAFELVSGANSTQRCDALAAEIRDFENRFYRKWILQGPPAERSEIRSLLFHAAQTGEPLPTSWRPVYRIIHGY